MFVKPPYQSGWVVPANCGSSTFIWLANLKVSFVALKAMGFPALSKPILLYANNGKAEYPST